MHAKIGAKVALSAAAVLYFSQTSFAENYYGKITLYHLNSNIPGRGPCIRMDPALPGSGLACVWDGRLFKEINDLVREAFFTGKTCTLTLSTTDKDGNHLLDIIQC
jgi:hypothetical protein